ncbi:MAG: LysR substrate-binding domain-containing protein [Planctomycetes bacterium]|nr:LysR substrate-binding domain-containing protein [Planctomycetota bacterium]
MDLDQLALFHAVAETGSITAGAQRIHLSQPAASRRLAELERTLGQRLFDRLPKRGVGLTSAGAVLYGYSGRIATLHAQAERSLRALVNLESGRLAIGASSTIGTYLLPAAVAAFRTSHPGIQVELRIGNSDAMLALLRDARIDLACTEDNRPDQGGDLAAEVLGGDDLVVVCRPGHALLARAPVAPAELARHPFVLREPGSGTRTVLAAAFAVHGLELEPDLVLGSNEAIKQAVAGCGHLAAMSRMAVADELAAGRLAELAVAGLALRRDLLVLRQRWRGDDPVARAFLRTLAPRLGRVAAFPSAAVA